MRAAGTEASSVKNIKGYSLVEMMIVTMFLVVILGVLGGTIIVVQNQYLGQRQLMEAQNNARVALDTMLRLIRMAGGNPEELTFEAIDPDPDGNTVLDSIQVLSDWNPGDGDLNDRYEDMTFTVSGGTLFKEEPSDGSPVAFVDNVQSLTFTYRDSSNSAVADPIATPEQIAFVDIELRTQVPDMPDMVFTSSAAVREREE